MASARLKEAKKVVEQMEAVRLPLLKRWELLSRYILPQRGIFPSSSDDAHSILESRNKDIVTRIATSALKKSAAGFTGGMTPESLPWVKWHMRDVTLEERQGVRIWLDIIEDSVRNLLKQASFYQAIHTCNQEFLTFGCMLLFMDSSPKTLCRFTCCTVGTYCVALNGDGELDTVSRVVMLSPRQLEQMFGKESLSSTTKTALEKEPFKPIKVVHLVRPREKFDPTKIDAKNMRFSSVFYELDTNAEDILHEGGYHEMPYMFASWDDGLTFYGCGPGDDALPDILQLQDMESQSLIAIDKMLNPPMRIPANYKQAVNDFAHGLTPIAPNLDGHAISPLYNAKFELQPVALKIQEIINRINETLLASVFTDMPLELRPKDMSATEYMERKRERLQMMGPTLASYEPRVLVPVLERAYGILDRFGILPPAPEILHLQPGSIVDFEFQSPLAQAMQSTKAAATKSLLFDIAQIAPIAPEALVKIDMEQAVDELARGVGAPGRVVRSDDEVAAIKQAQAEQQQALQQQAMQQQATEQLTALASVPAGDDSMIGRIMGEGQNVQ